MRQTKNSHFFIHVLIIFAIICLSSATPVLAQHSTPQTTPTATSQATLETTPAGPQPVYIVQPGDTISSISIEFGVIESELIQANNLTDPNQIKAGDSLVIPGLDGISGTLTTETVSLGDSLESLSRRYQVPQDLLIRLNHLTSPEELYAGASLIIPQQPNQKALGETNPLSSEPTLLELSVLQGVDPWSMVTLNGLEGTWDYQPGDVLVLPPTSSAAIAASADSAPTLSIQPQPFVQGHTFVVKASASPGLTFSGSFMGHDLHFFPDGKGSLVALAGVYALANPGLYPLQIQWSLPTGQKHTFEQSVQVIAENYHTDPHLIVDPETIDPNVTGPEDKQVATLTLPATTTRFWTGVFKAPGYDPTWITAGFGDRRTYNNDPTTYFHTGVDYGGGVGLPVKAPAPGVVVFTGLLDVRGNATIIDHGWGVYSGLYHQSQFLVKVGDHVDTGQVIGLVGATGRVTGPHLHWEVWVGGVQVQPLDWLAIPYP